MDMTSTAMIGRRRRRCISGGSGGGTPSAHDLVMPPPPPAAAAATHRGCKHTAQTSSSTSGTSSMADDHGTVTLKPSPARSCNILPQHAVGQAKLWSKVEIRQHRRRNDYLPNAHGVQFFSVHGRYGWVREAHQEACPTTGRFLGLRHVSAATIVLAQKAPYRSPGRLK